MKDLHTALKTEIVKEASASGITAMLVKLQQGKNDIYYTLHLGLSSMSISGGIQQTDFAARLGFSMQYCAFQPSRRCYSREVEEGFDVQGFVEAFSASYDKLKSAQQDLNRCGIYLDGDEGLAYYMGGAPRRRSRFRYVPDAIGEAHRAQQIEQMKESEDEVFRYVLTWLEDGNDKGWTIHYLPKHPPISRQVNAVMNFFKLGTFTECPENDFDFCRWKFIPFENDDDDGPRHRRSAEIAHGYFDSHAAYFGKGLQQVVEAESIISKYGMYILDGAYDDEQGPIQIPALEETMVLELKEDGVVEQMPDAFDVAITFAGSDRAKAEQLATIVREKGFTVFYDNFYPEHLWGKDLPAFFHKVYSEQARFCVMFISQEYAERMWTNHERQSAQSRAIKEYGNEYILPIQIEKAEIPGLPDTIGYLSLDDFTIEEVANLLVDKINAS